MGLNLTTLDLLPRYGGGHPASGLRRKLGMIPQPVGRGVVRQLLDIGANSVLGVGRGGLCPGH